MKGPLLFAHRGASLEHVENTLPAFEAALALGADVIESDVHICRDGHAVLAHDADGERVAGVDRRIADCTLSEVTRWNLSRARIPSLDEALGALPDACFNLDLKVHEFAVLPSVLEVIARHRAQPRVLLTSFSAAVTRRLRALGYGGPIGLGRAEAVAAVFAPAGLLRGRAGFLRAGARLQVPPRSAGISLARRGLIDKLASCGLPVDYWVINDAAQAAHLLELGAQGIVTDDVRAMAQVFSRSPLTAGWRARHAALMSAR